MSVYIRGNVINGQGLKYNTCTVQKIRVGKPLKELLAVKVLACGYSCD